MTPAADLRSAYDGARVLLTGHTGFKGAWLALWLAQLGAEVHGLALEPPTEPSLFDEASIEALMASSMIGDIRDAGVVAKAATSTRPTHIFHLAAQPLVRTGHETPVTTFETNVLGTVNVLEAARSCADLASVVVVTSDKCYDNLEAGHAYAERDALGGHDPYSASKAATELVTASYRDSFLLAQGVGVATARAGNVIGGGDWALDRIIPDCIRSLEAESPITIRNPSAVRPWQHVLEPLDGYLRLGARLADDAAAFSGPWNFGPSRDGHLDVGSLVERVIEQWGEGSWRAASTAEAPHEAQLLHLNSTKSHTRLGWQPTWNVDVAIAETVSWYRSRREGAAVPDLTRAQLEAFTTAAAATGVA